MIADTEDVAKLLDKYAEVFETAARLLRNGDSPHRIAHYLEESAITARDAAVSIRE
jgi:arginyl-tRNA synthetase